MVNLIFTLISAILGLAMFGAVLLANPKTESSAADPAAEPGPVGLGTTLRHGDARPFDARALYLASIDDIRAKHFRATGVSRPAPGQDQNIGSRRTPDHRPRPPGPVSVQMAAQTFASPMFGKGKPSRLV